MNQHRLASCPGPQDMTSGHRQAVMSMAGVQTCSYVNHGETGTDQVHLDSVNPDRFKHNEYRYQMFARPANFLCDVGGAFSKAKPPTANYAPAHTDVRALEQTMYIPIVPSNPGGETEVTFPMTPRTMGHPDVTSACCVPVIPSQPGYKNLTPGILPGPCTPMNGPLGGAIPSSGAAGCPYLRQMCGATGGSNCGGCYGGGLGGSGAGYGMGGAGAGAGALELTGASYPQQRRGCGCSHCAPQIIRPPSNAPGGSCLGLPDTFPAAVQLQHAQMAPCSFARQMAPVPTLQLPHYTGALGPDMDNMPNASFMATGFYDGMPRDKVCMTASMIRHQDRMRRFSMRAQETTVAKRRRMREVYGHFGSYLLPTPYQKRHDIQIRPDLIQSQGNGFSWEYPMHQNRQCYVLQRNTRCS